MCHLIWLTTPWGVANNFALVDTLACETAWEFTTSFLGGGLPSTNVKYSVENCGVHSATSLTIFTVCLTLFVKELEFNYFISNSIIINILIMFKNH